MKTTNTDIATNYYLMMLHKVLPRRPAREHWLKTYNILLDGKCPEELLDTKEGLQKVTEVLKEMAGYP